MQLSCGCLTSFFQWRIPRREVLSYCSPTFLVFKVLKRFEDITSVDDDKNHSILLWLRYERKGLCLQLVVIELRGGCIMKVQSSEMD